MTRLLFVITIIFSLFGFNADLFAAQQKISVGLVIEQFTAELGIEGTAKAKIFTADGALKKEIDLSEGRYFINASDNSINIEDKNFGKDVVLLEAEKGKNFSVNKRTYRGKIKISLTEDGKNLYVINILPLEEYLYSVAGNSIPLFLPDDAIKAQIVALRTLAYRQAVDSRAKYDIKATDENLLYTGINAERKMITSLTDATEGEVVLYNGRAIRAYSTVCSGGYTEDGKNVLGEKIPYLISREDFDSEAPLYKWERSFNPKDIVAALEREGYIIGTLESIRLSTIDMKDIDRTDTGRVLQMSFGGTEGNVLLTGSEVKKIFGLESTLFEVKAERPFPDSIQIPIENRYGMEIGRKEISIKVNESGGFKNPIENIQLVSGVPGEKVIFKGRGSGSGLGLSLWGAKAMADKAGARSKNYYVDILKYYYPGTYIRQIY